MGLNYIQRPFGQELALRLLKDWIQNEFPLKNVEYRGKVFSFHTDLPNQHMEELADAKAEGMDKVRIMIRLLSIEPRITQEDLDIIPSSMLMALWTGLFPKKAQTTSQSPTIEPISSVVSSISPEVRSADGESWKPSA